MPHITARQISNSTMGCNTTKRHRSRAFLSLNVCFLTSFLAFNNRSPRKSVQQYETCIKFYNSIVRTSLRCVRKPLKAWFHAVHAQRTIYPRGKCTEKIWNMCHNRALSVSVMTRTIILANYWKVFSQNSVSASTLKPAQHHQYGIILHLQCTKKFW